MNESHYGELLWGLNNIGLADSLFVGMIICMPRS